jgi:O-antigen/teichoic acid export membrane protein
VPADRGGGVILARLQRRFPFIVNSGYASVTAGSAGLLLLLLTVAGRFLNAADYGRFSYAVALTTIVETVMDGGLGQVTIRAVAREPGSADRMFRDVLGLKLVWVSTGVVALLIITPLLRHESAVVRLCYIMTASSAMRSYLLTVRGLLQGLNRFDFEAVIVVTDRLLLLGLGSAALIGGLGVFGLAGAFVVARVLMLVGSTRALRRIIGSLMPAFDLKEWRQLQSAALPLGLFMIAVNLYAYIDTVILGFISTDAEIGYYNAAYRLYEGLTYVPSVLAAVVSPRLSRLFVEDRREHRALLVRVLLAAVAFGLVLGGVAVLTAHPIVVTIFGGAYEKGTQPLQILASGAVFVFATWILHAAAISINLDRRLVGTTAVGLGVNVIFNLLFIPRWGISGAAAATVLAEVVTVSLLLIQIRRRLREP